MIRFSYILFPLALLAASSCGALRPTSPSVTDSTRVEVHTVTETVHDTAYVELPVIVERIVNDIDGIVRIVRFPGWQNTSTGKKEISRNLRDVIMRKYRIKDQDVFNKAYSYVEQYY